MSFWKNRGHDWRHRLASIEIDFVTTAEIELVNHHRMLVLRSIAVANVGCYHTMFGSTIFVSLLLVEHWPNLSYHTRSQHKATSISSCTTYHVMMPHSPTPLHHVIISLPWFNFSNKTMYLDLRWPKYAFCPSASSTYFGSALARCYISSTTVGGYQVTTWL